ncbi:MAG: hypothetical protein V4463_07010 [Pseudomonadota bacterium]
MIANTQAIAATVLLAALAIPARGAGTPPAIEAGAAMTSQSITARPDGQAELALALEGAGKLSLGTVTIRFHIACAITDLLAGQRVVEGSGQCLLSATDGGKATVQFQTNAGVGDAGYLQFNGGTHGFAGVVARIPVVVSVNPYKVAGKKVFFIETSTDAAQSANF